MTPSAIARNPPTTATCSQVISRTLPWPSQNSWSASPLASVSAAAFLALSGSTSSTRYGGRTASYRHDLLASQTSASTNSTTTSTPTVTWRAGCRAMKCQPSGASHH